MLKVSSMSLKLYLKVKFSKTAQTIQRAVKIPLKNSHIIKPRVIHTQSEPYVNIEILSKIQIVMLLRKVSAGYNNILSVSAETTLQSIILKMI